MNSLPKTRRQAVDLLNQQPFTSACRDRHEVVPVYDRNLLGEKTQPERVLGWCYRLKNTGRSF